MSASSANVVILPDIVGLKSLNLVSIYTPNAPRTITTSLATTTPASQVGIDGNPLCGTAITTKALVVRNLSARGSRSRPRPEPWLYRLATYPSAKSVRPATRKIANAMSYRPRRTRYKKGIVRTNLRQVRRFAAVRRVRGEIPFSPVDIVRADYTKLKRTPQTKKTGAFRVRNEK